MLAMFYQQMRNDLVGEHGSLRDFTARGPLISKDAIEIYSMQYAPMRAFLWGLTPMIAATVERTLLPTYAYLRIYQQGDVCRVHTDRQACEHSLSLTIAYGENQPWALSVGTDRIDEPKPVVVDDSRARLSSRCRWQSATASFTRACIIATAGSIRTPTVGPPICSCTGSMRTAAIATKLSIGRRSSRARSQQAG